MKYFVIYLKILVFVVFINTNTHAQELISFSGGNSADEYYFVEWSIGEQFTSTHQQGAYILTEGFHQLSLEVTGIYQNEIAISCFATYPNPVNTELNIVNSGYINSYSIIIYNNSGNVVFYEDYNAAIQAHHIHMENLQSSIYYLKIIDSSGELLQTSKIVKF